jgi:hypothetical protein
MRSISFIGLAKLWVEWSVGGVADLAERNPGGPKARSIYRPVETV